MISFQFASMHLQNGQATFLNRSLIKETLEVNEIIVNTVVIWHTALIAAIYFSSDPAKFN